MEAVHPAIERYAPFGDLTPEELTELSRNARVDQCLSGMSLFLQGEPAERVFLIDRGQVRLSKTTEDGEQVMVAILAETQLFAVVAAMRETTYPLAAEAMTPSTILSWSRSAIAPLFLKHPGLVSAAMELVATRMRELQDRYHELATLSVPQRLARELLRLVDEFGSAGRSGIAVGLRLSRQDLAEMTGTTLYTVSRILSRWSVEGIVESGRQRVEILDMAALEQRAKSPGRVS